MGEEYKFNAAFDTWFESSVVRTENGSPLEVYHGTAVAVGGRRTSFDLNPPSRTTCTASQALGIFFARHKSEAETYAEAACGEGVGAEPHVVHAFLSVSNPFRITVSEFYERTEYRDEEEIWAMREDLISKGYDGIFVGDKGDIVVFHPGQIKSSLVNSGRYDFNSNDITDGFYFRNLGAKRKAL